MSSKKRWKYWVRMVGIIVLTFLLSRFIVYDFSSISYFAPMEKTSDFTISDFYQIVADSRDLRQLEEDIVIVSIDSCNRQEIGSLLEQIDFCAPAAIGLDVFFEHSMPGDSALIDILTSCENLVMPCSVEARTDGRGYAIHKASFSNCQELRSRCASVNLAGNDRHSVIREFRPFFPSETDSIPHFATALLKLARPQCYESLKQRGNELENIYYPGRDFSILQPHEVLEHPEELEGRIVLVGSIHERWDSYSTPVSAQMPGVLIHAHSIATVLEEEYIHYVADPWVWCIAIVLCILVLSIKDWCNDSKYEGLITRVAQLLILYLIVVVGYGCFKQFSLCVDFTIPLLMVGLGQLALDLWVGGAELIRTMKKKLTKDRS